MKKVREILRLKANGLSQHKIGQILSISSGAVNKYLKMIGKAGVKWPLPEGMGDSDLKALLIPDTKTVKPFIPLNYIQIREELKRKGVTLQLLHKEYCGEYPKNHYSYRQYCALYKEWRNHQKLTMIQDHKGGDKMFTDYAGLTVPIIVNRKTGETKEASIFLAVMGATSYTYVEATWDQTTYSWIGSHVRSFQFFGGVPALLVPDNLKSAIKDACRYDPNINSTYEDMARHYNTAILPARPYRPQDKAKVENGVQVVERWILARIRHEKFYSLEDLNKRIKKLLKELNHEPFQKKDGSRWSLFQSVDAPFLKPLPEKTYEYSEFYHRKVGLNYHIELEEHFYSVPYLYVGKEIDIRVTERIVEVLHDGKRIVSHQRSKQSGKTTTLEHMPKRHLKHAEWTIDKAMEWSQTVGPKMQELLRHALEHKPHPDQIKRFCLGFYRLEKAYGSDRLERACERATLFGVYTYKSVLNILEKRLDEDVIEEKPKMSIVHSNIRGSTYYEMERRPSC